MNLIYIILTTFVIKVSCTEGQDNLEFINNYQATGVKYTEADGSSYYGLYGYKNNTVEAAMV